MSAPEIDEVGGFATPAGQRTNLELRVARLPTGTWVSLPVAVIRGNRPGPTVWLSAAIHGDELNGIEIVRRVLPLIPPDKLSGAVIAVPIVNVFGFLTLNRYLPDRRDLNRTFPGSERGSLASRLAALFMSEIVSRCDFGIDLHTGSNHRTNLPQVRGDLTDEETLAMARAFRAPIMIKAKSRDGSLRQAAIRAGKRVLVYEAGETHRFHRPSIRLGVRGILRCLEQRGQLASTTGSDDDPAARAVRRTHWIRAPRGGILLLDVELGDPVAKGQTVGNVSDTFSEVDRQIVSAHNGIVIGMTTNPIVNRGDAAIHVAELGNDEQT